MATELITRTWCDLHLADGEQVPAVAFWRFGIDAPGHGRGRWQWISLDVCQQHADEQMEPMAELLVKVGATFEAPAAPPKRSSLPKIREPVGPPVANRVPAKHPPKDAAKPYTCETCGREFTTNQGLSMHGRRTKDHPNYDPTLTAR